MVRDWPRDSFPRQPSFQQQCFQPNARHQSFQQDRFPGDAVPRQDSFQEERYGIDPDHGRFQEAFEMQRRQPPMQIDEALRSHCGIAAKQYFVAAVSEDGEPMTFFSPGQKLNEGTIRQFFDIGKFQQVMARVDSGANPNLDEGMSFDDGQFSRNGSLGRIRPPDRRRGSIFEDWSGSPARQARKRPRQRNPITEDDDVPMTVSSRKGIKVGDCDSVWSFYEQRFKNCQQTACKLIAKAWVKAVEPKKQSTHPYTGSDEKAPDWWPKPWGPTKDDKVRHKEPDHLYKRERVHLLAHILRLVLEPNAKQHGDIQKLGLNVKKLEETTYEALSAFFMDNETNAKKRPYLSEIFKMARQEERFKNGEIDGATEVYVMAEDKVPENYASDNDDGAFGKEEDDLEMRPKVNTQIGVVQTPTAASASAPPAPGGHGPFIGDLPVRGTSFTPTMIPADMPPSQSHSFVESGGITVTDHAVVTASSGPLTLDMVASPHDTSRRPSVFSEYASPVGNNMYTQQWPQAPSAGPTQSTMYGYTQAPPNHQQAAFMSQAVPMNSNQPFMGGSFDGAPRSEYDGNGTPMFRAGDMAHAPPVNPQQNYFVQNDGRNNMRVMSQVVDGLPRNSL